MFKQEDGTLSTHEKQLLKIKSKIEQMEKANLEPKSWTMQGEVIDWFTLQVPFMVIRIVIIKLSLLAYSSCIFLDENDSM